MTGEPSTESDAPVAGAPAADTAPVAQDQRVLLHMPVDVRSLSLVLVAVWASLFVLRWASAVFIPLLLGVMFSYALSPVVDWMHCWHVLRVLGAAVLLAGSVGGAGETV